MDNMKYKLLWISPYVPFDKVAHAGGKIHNYYLKELNKKNIFDIHLISFSNIKDKEKLDLDEYKISNDITFYQWEGFDGLKLKISNNLSRMNIYGKFAGLTTSFFAKHVMKSVLNLKNNGYNPDIIILQWTEMVFLKDEIARIYPNAKFVCIEEDVSFLGYERKYKSASNFLKKSFLKNKYEQIKKVELDKLNSSDLVILNNHKDEKLVLENNLKSNIWVWCPYFQNSLNINRENINKNILFYGAMFREENWKSALWFIDNVMPLIKDKEVNFIVAGNRPNPELVKRNSDNVKILGFVEDISEYFQTSLCMAAPLLLGAGVKIKVLEAMSSGIPVLTNEIGIEGINATDKKDFFFCTKPQEYADAIEYLLNHENEQEVIENNSKQFIKNNYNLKKDTDVFAEKLLNILK